MSSVRAASLAFETLLLLYGDKSFSYLKLNVGCLGTLEAYSIDDETEARYFCRCTR